jgi:hypothetical protein
MEETSPEWHVTKVILMKGTKEIWSQEMGDGNENFDARAHLIHRDPELSLA